jgi:hypothetical protein
MPCTLNSHGISPRFLRDNFHIAAQGGNKRHESVHGEAAKSWDGSPEPSEPMDGPGEPSHGTYPLNNKQTIRFWGSPNVVNSARFDQTH